VLVNEQSRGQFLAILQSTGGYGIQSRYAVSSRTVDELQLIGFFTFMARKPNPLPCFHYATGRIGGICSSVLLDGIIGGPGLGAGFFPARCFLFFLSFPDFLFLLPAFRFGFGLKPCFSLLQPGETTSRILKFLRKFICPASRPETLFKRTCQNVEAQTS
jgi:hypothetical protein